MNRVFTDDIGSFPLVEGKNFSFDSNYFQAYKFLLENEPASLLEHRGLQFNFYEPIIYSFLMKLRSGIDVINYPQHFSMYAQFTRPMGWWPDAEAGPYSIDAKKAIVPEVHVIRHYVNNTDFEGLGIPEFSLSRNQVQLKVCVTGPVELYVKTELGFTVYKDLLKNVASSVNAFLKSSIINDKRIKTKVVAIDEPSLGFIDLFNTSPGDIPECLDVATQGLPDDVIVQVHLHSLRDAEYALKSKNIDVLTCEFASDPTNVIDRQLLERHGKKIRVGICRTNYNALIGARIERGEKVGTDLQSQLALVDSEERIASNLQKAIDHYGLGNLSSVGPDCGLSSWAPPQLAQTLLKRVVGVVQNKKPW